LDARIPFARQNLKNRAVVTVLSCRRQIRKRTQMSPRHFELWFFASIDSISYRIGPLIGY
jgi:hypothetical protein